MSRFGGEIQWYSQRGPRLYPNENRFLFILGKIEVQNRIAPLRNPVLPGNPCTATIFFNVGISIRDDIKFYKIQILVGEL